MSVNWLLAFRFLRRDWRAGELRVLLAALIIAVAAVTSVSFFTDRVYQGLLSQANDLMGADLVLSSDHGFPASYLEQARKRDLRSVQTLTFPSMVLGPNGAQLAMLKAVESGFPLRGHLRVADEPFAPDRVAVGVPKPGTVWLEPRVLTALGVKVGDTVTLGAKQFSVAAVLTGEPGRGGDVFSIAPRAMLNLEDLAATQLVQPASRVNFSLLFAGPTLAIADYRQMVESLAERGVSAQGVQDARPEIRVALDRAGRFLSIAALSSVILAGVAVALAARRFARRHLDACAVMRCLGATQQTIARVYAYQMLTLGTVGSLLGCLLGFIAHLALVAVLGSLVGVDLPAPSWAPAGVAFVTGIATLAGFALPPLFQLKNVPALRVLRRELGALGTPGVLTYGLGLLALAGLMFWQAGDVKLGGYVVGGTVAALLILVLIALGMVSALRVLRGRPGSSWRFGLTNIARRSAGSVVQVVAFGLGIMALLLLTVLRGELLDEWQKTLPENTPNRFLINIQPAQVPELKRFFAENAVDQPEFFPMIRARLEAINAKPVNSNSFQDERARRLAEREFNLSWSAALSPDNRIVGGHWWTDAEQGRALLSVEDGIAKTLSINLGDKLTYSVAGEKFTGEVASIRTVEWDSFRPNFFVLGVPGFLDNLPATYMTSFYLGGERHTLLNTLLQRFPNVTVIDVAAIMAQVRAIVERVTLAVEYVFLFTLAAGVMVLYAGIQATQDERMLENAILRTLGGSRKQIMQALAAEFGALGALSGLMATGLAAVLAYVLATQVLNVPYHLSPLLWVYGVVGGALGVGLAGVLGSRKVVSQPPLTTLRRVTV